MNDPTPETLDESLRATARVLLDLAKKHVPRRLDRVRLFARATRAAIDALSPTERGPGFVVRTWELPELTPSTQQTLEFIWTKFDSCITSAKARAILLAHATRLAADDLSPDEQTRALSEATQIIGSPP